MSRAGFLFEAQPCFVSYKFLADALASIFVLVVAG